MKDFVSPLSVGVVEKDYAQEVIDQSSVEMPTSEDMGGQEIPVAETDDFAFDFNDDLGDPIDEGYDEEGGEGGMEVSDDVQEVGSEWVSDFACDLIESEGARMSHNYTKLSETTVKLGEIEGRIKEGTLEQVKVINKNNKKAIEETFKTQMEMIKEPLKKVLAKRNVKVSPESALIGAVVLSALIIFFQLRDIKKTNDELIATIIKNNK